MRFDLLTLFPDIFDSYFQTSILKRAQEKKKIKIYVHNFRDCTVDKHKTVDEKPYGGGVGMLLKIEPLYKCLQKIKAKKNTKDTKIILTSAKGKLLTQQELQTWSKLKRLVIICGHYEGVDERIKQYIDEEVSIGKYVLTGGELAGMVLVDGIARLLPGVLGKDASSVEESYSAGYLEYPQYTRPEEFKGLRVPKILLSGDHQKIKNWREKQQKKVKN